METSQILENPSQNTLITGLDGPITLPENIIQKIWFKQDFLKEALTTSSGKSLTINHPGQWNTLEGPDFKNASITIDGQTLCGDVEIHFHPENWLDHDHQLNPSFNNVILHVCLFPSKKPNPPPHSNLGYCPETLTLLYRLNQGLEEYATEDALLTLENRDHLEILQNFLEKPLADKKQIFQEKALTRWQQKLAFTQKRIQTSSFEESCHQMALEVLDYRRNRAPMSQIAIQYPLPIMASSPPSPQQLFASQRYSWRLAGIRPANHPKKRLGQYLTLLNKNPNWPTQFLELAKTLPGKSSINSTSEFRKTFEVNNLYKEIKENIFHNTITSTRFHTLMLDALIPLAAAITQRNLFPLFYHTLPGDVPERVQDLLNHSNILQPRTQPTCNGLNQGALQLFLDLGL